MSHIEIIGNLILEHDRSGRLIQATSYSAALFARSPDGVGVLNVTKYSTTTSKHQGLVKRELGLEVVSKVDKASRDVTPGELIALAGAV
jgi:hypothetical protein